MALTKYFHCTTCNKKVIATLNECPDCGLELGGQSPLSEKAVDKKIAELAEASEASAGSKAAAGNSVNKNEDHMECPNPACAGKVYPLGTSMCPECGMPLHMVLGEAAGTDSDAVNSAVNNSEGRREGDGTANGRTDGSADRHADGRVDAHAAKEDGNNEKEVFAPTRENADFIYGEEIENPDWELEFIMYDEAGKETVVTRFLDRTIIPVGRIYLCEHVFHEYPSEQTKSCFARVSRHNGFIILDRGRVFVQYDCIEAHGGSESKAEICINNIPIKREGKHEVKSGDTVTFGADGNKYKSLSLGVKEFEKSETLHVCAEREKKPDINEDLLNAMKNVNFQVSERIRPIAPNEKSQAGVNNQATAESAKASNTPTKSEILRNEVKDLKDQLAHYANQIKEHSERISGIDNKVDVLSKKYEDEIKEARASYNMSDDDYLDEFFKGNENCKQILYSLNDEQKEMLINAAILEYRCKKEMEAGDGGSAIGYKSAVRCFAGMIESFIFEVIDERFINTYASATKKAKLADMQQEQKEAFLNDLQWVFIHSENGQLRFNNGEISRMSKDYLAKKNITDNDEIRRLKSKIGGQFLKIDTLRKIRNDGSHTKPAFIPANTQGDELGYFDYYKPKVLDVLFYKVLREVKNVLIEGMEPNPRVHL